MGKGKATLQCGPRKMIIEFHHPRALIAHRIVLIWPFGGILVCAFALRPQKASASGNLLWYFCACAYVFPPSRLLLINKLHCVPKYVKSFRKLIFRWQVDFSHWAYQTRWTKKRRKTSIVSKETSCSNICLRKATCKVHFFITVSLGLRASRNKSKQRTRSWRWRKCKTWR